MNNYNELKLAVYESGLAKDDISEIIDVMESCDDDELQEVCEEVLELLEYVNYDLMTESRGNAVSKIQDIKARASYNANADRNNAAIKREINSIYDKIDERRSNIQKGRPGDASKIRGEISDYMDRIADLKKKIAKNDQTRNKKSKYRRDQEELTRMYSNVNKGGDIYPLHNDMDEYVRTTSKDTKNNYRGALKE